MRGAIFYATLAIVLGSVGTWLMLPHRLGTTKPRQIYVIGTVLMLLGLFMMAGLWRAPGPYLTRVFFYVFAAAATVGGVLTITSRNPVYSALWFASVLLSTAGLFLLAGAQFLAAGTVIVYAGAIIVTFLFVIMLAQSEGQALYDRMARSPLRATFSCFLLMWTLIYALIAARQAAPPPSVSPLDERRVVAADLLVAHHRLQGEVVRKAGGVDEVRKTPVEHLMERTVRPTITIAPGGAHVAGLGAALFTDHLVAVELVGALLFVALVGAAAIATPKPPVRPGSAPAFPGSDPAQARAMGQSRA